jgi:hypothetical protein
MAPRHHRCAICRKVTAIEHVALMMYDETMEPLPISPVVDYLQSIGMGGTRRQFVRRISAHRKHIDAWIERGARVLPVHEASNVIRIPPKTGDTRWIDVSQNAMDVGNDALRELNARLQTGEMETGEVIALARLGVTAATNRGALEQKGRALTGIDRLLQLAAGGVGKGS